MTRARGFKGVMQRTPSDQSATKNQKEVKDEEEKKRPGPPLLSARSVSASFTQAHGICPTREFTWPLTVRIPGAKRRQQTEMDESNNES